jgi:plastocyanin
VIKKTLILPVLAVAAIAAGCGSDSSDSASTYGNPTPAATGTAAPAKTATAAPAKTAAAAPDDQAPADKGAETKVDIANFAFAPAEIEAKVGDTITFTNQDSAPHTATATAGAGFDSGALEQGKSFSYTTKKAGTIKFVCSFHPNMVGTITVS